MRLFAEDADDEIARSALPASQKTKVKATANFARENFTLRATVEQLTARVQYLTQRLQAVHLQAKELVTMSDVVTAGSAENSADVMTGYAPAASPAVPCDGN